jgi:hypothetical protein
MAVKRFTKKNHGRKMTRKIHGRKGLVKTQKGGDGKNKLTFLERVKLAVRKNTQNIKEAKTNLSKAKKAAPSIFSTIPQFEHTKSQTNIKYKKEALKRARIAAVRKQSFA